MSVIFGAGVLLFRASERERAGVEMGRSTSIEQGRTELSRGCVWIVVVVVVLQNGVFFLFPFILSPLGFACFFPFPGEPSAKPQCPEAPRAGGSGFRSSNAQNAGDRRVESSGPESPK